MDEEVPYALFEEVLQTHRFVINISQVQTFEDAWNFLEKCVEKGKYLKQEGEHLQNLMKQNIEKEQLWKDKQK